MTLFLLVAVIVYGAYWAGKLQGFYAAAKLFEPDLVKKALERAAER